MARRADGQGGPADRDSTVLVYDGACPFCTELVVLTRLRRSVGKVRLVDARQGGAMVDAVRAAGLDLDAGMVLRYRGHFYHGAQCLHMLAMLSTRSDAFNRALACLFHSPSFCRLSYPLLRAGRNLVLALRGTRKLN